jgi:hypothetical protein
MDYRKEYKLYTSQSTVYILVRCRENHPKQSRGSKTSANTSIIASMNKCTVLLGYEVLCNCEFGQNQGWNRAQLLRRGNFYQGVKIQAFHEKNY